ncbi:MAG: alpha/beta hydrolase [Pseudomonadota bacterium]
MTNLLKLMAAAFCAVVGNPAGAELEFSPCYLTGSGGNGNLHAQCATWQQPLDRSNNQGDQIELSVVKIPSTALDPAPDAFTLINGGPGASSIDMMVDLRGLLGLFTRERDVIVIDQRGTGRSAPMTCPGLVDDSVTEMTPKIVSEATQACLDALPYDPRFFTTTVGVEDLDALRDALGYEQLSLYGVSYGTRVVMQYMRQYPERTRAAIIDGVVPPTRPLGLLIARHSQNALDAALNDCSGHAPCAAAYPDLATRFNTLRETLLTEAKPVNLIHPLTGAPTDIEVEYGHLAAWIRFSLYAPESTALIPLMVYQALEQNNYIPIASSALQMIEQISTSMNYGMHNAVVCTEDAPFFPDPAELDTDEIFAATYLGQEMFDTLIQICGEWPAGVRHPDFKQPLESDVPTLVLSGEFDPITPATWGEEVMPGLANAKHIIAPGQGHGIIARGCVPQLVSDFVEDADPTALDDGCIKHLQRYPFFVDMMGPAP